MYEKFIYILLDGWGTCHSLESLMARDLSDHDSPILGIVTCDSLIGGYEEIQNAVKAVKGGKEE